MTGADKWTKYSTQKPLPQKVPETKGANTSTVCWPKTSWFDMIVTNKNKKTIQKSFSKNTLTLKRSFLTHCNENYFEYI